MLKKFILSTCFVICLTGINIINAQDANLRIDISKEYQTIDNFGASDCWSFQKIGSWYTPKKEEIADLLFSQEKGIGLSAWRFNIGGGKEGNRISHPWRSVETFEISEGVYDWSRQSEESWFLHAAKERGVDQFIAFVNSPPARMTLSGFTNCNNGLGSTNLKEGFEGQFATYLADIIKHFRDDEGINFKYVSPVNEPIWEWNQSNQEGNRASNIDIKNVVNALYNEFEQKGLDTEIMISESGNLQAWHFRENNISNEYGETYGNYLTEFCNDDNINYKISKALCGHSYWSDLLETELIDDRMLLKIKMLPYINKGWRYWQTEYMQMEGPNGEGGNGRDLTMETALNNARVIHFDMTILQASAWQWWTAVSPEDYKDGLIYTNYLNGGDNQSVIEAKNLWVLGNYSRFIRPGSKRVDCLGAADKKSLMSSAYKDTENGNLIIVVINVTDDEKELSFEVAGADGDLNFTPYITSDNSGDDLRQGSAFNFTDGYVMPARSVVTFVGSLDNITGIEESNNLPESPKLLNNYPNPFNPETNIEYQVSTKSRVVIDVFDTLGRKVDTVVDAVKAAGNYSVRFNPSELAGGVYIARMSCDNYTGSTKMIYMK